MQLACERERACMIRVCARLEQYESERGEELGERFGAKVLAAFVYPARDSLLGSTLCRMNAFQLFRR